MITPTERQTLAAILNSEYHDCSGEDCIGNPVWSDCLEVSTLSRHQVAGALASLQAKGYVNTYGPASDPTVEITRAGWETLREVAANG